jgi:hypothetical protein
MERSSYGLINVVSPHLNGGIEENHEKLRLDCVPDVILSTYR